MGCCCAAPPVASDAPLPIVVLGLPGVGKTSFIEFLAGEFNPRDPPITTAGLIQRQLNVHGRAYLFYDVCAFVSFADVWLDIVKKSRAIILVFDRPTLEHGFFHVTSTYEKLAEPIVQRKLPTLILVNRAADPIDLSELESLNAKHLSGTAHRTTAFPTFGSAVLKSFEWLVADL
jgi:GTPase SAR1 family protein